jgi:NAD(P)-dependent dehydrogenase (short-subunit alcohol dehydrogenase family)
VVVTDINLETAQATVEAIKAVATHPNFKAEAVQLDVTSEEAVKAAIAYTSKLFGRIDYVVNSAGVSSAHCLHLPSSSPCSFTSAD